MKKYFIAPTILLISIFSNAVFSEEPKSVVPELSYFTLEPEITTNYITQGKKLGFLNVKIDLMVADKSLLKIVEYHQPLIRDTIIMVLNQENEMRVKSIAGRESIRQVCLEKVNEVLSTQTKQKVVTDLFFSKYLYQ